VELLLSRGFDWLQPDFKVAPASGKTMQVYLSLAFEVDFQPPTRGFLAQGNLAVAGGWTMRWRGGVNDLHSNLHRIPNLFGRK
jgi:hypothetical protein